MSVAMLHRGFASSTTTSRPVLSTDSSTVSSSSGLVVRRSITSTETPLPASCSAASSEVCTIRPSVTMVTSLPSRTTFASPNGTV